MSYQALYRVWRPQSFDELVGQPLIAETLKNAVKNQQIKPRLFVHRATGDREDLCC